MRIRTKDRGHGKCNETHFCGEIKLDAKMLLVILINSEGFSLVIMHCLVVGNMMTPEGVTSFATGKSFFFLNNFVAQTIEAVFFCEK